MKLILNALLIGLFFGPSFKTAASETEELGVFSRLSNACDVKQFYEKTQFEYLKNFAASKLKSMDTSSCDVTEPSWKRMGIEEKKGYRTRWLVDRVLMLDGADRLKKAGQGDDMLARALLGYAITKGHGVPKDPERGFSLVSDACASGEKFGCLTKTFSIYLGDGTEVDRTTGKILFQDLCKNGFGVACDSIGNLHVFGEANTKKDATIFNDYFEKACSYYTGRGCRRLGDSYKKGRGVEADAIIAINLYVQACGLYDDVACVSAWDSLLDSPKATNSNIAKSIEILELGCTLGNGAACFKVGDVFNYGRYGLPQNYQRAYGAMEMACQRGQSNGCFNQGSWLISGKGVEANSKHAIAVLQPLCDRKKPDYQACNNAGAAAFRGIGMRAPDFSAAAEFYRKACYFGGMNTACESVIDMLVDRQTDPVKSNELSVLRQRVAK